MAPILPVMTHSILHLGLMEDTEIDLDLAALELAALDHPGVDLDPYVDALRSMQAALHAVGGNAASSVDRAQALSVMMAEDFGFSGDRARYDDPQNADLIAVIDRRLGLPISLSILYVAMARRLGWSAMPLNTPGHVLVRLGDALDPVIIDPFNDGRIVAPEQVAALLDQMTGQATIADGMLPLSNRSALVRLLLNQATRAEQAGDPARALVLYERMTIVAPMHAHGWWERARLQLTTKDVTGARNSLSAMLEITRDEDLRLQVSAALDALPKPTHF